MTDLACARAVSLVGLHGTVVEVQTHIGPGIVGTTLVGLPDASLREAKERVRAAFSSCGIPSLNRRVTVNLTPADLPKAGSGFDLAIAVSMLVARRVLLPEVAEGTLFAAELGLDGSLRPVGGALPVGLAAYRNGYGRLVVAQTMAYEAALAPGVEVFGCAHLADLITAFGVAGRVEEVTGWELLTQMEASRRPPEIPGDSDTGRPSGNASAEDLSDVYGQRSAVEALTVAAVGRHHVLMVGPPGVGKTMLARRVRDLLPDLDTEEALEVTAVQSLAGRSQPLRSLQVRPPLEQPHHSATLPALIGGGSPIRPGAISLAHAGVLVLDEAPEFQMRTLDALRQPLENGTVTIHRANSKVTYPARFQMVMTANPCPCGGSTDPGNRTCVCSHAAKERYRARISGPLLDRVDLRMSVARPHHQAVGQAQTVSTREARGLIEEARERAARRWADKPWRYNAEVPGRYLRQSALKDRTELRRLGELIDKGHLSMRGADRVLRMAWSVADLRAASRPGPSEVEVALGLRRVEERP